MNETLNASGRDCTNNNELLHKMGVYNVMPCSYPYLQVTFYKRFDGSVSITVVLKNMKRKLKFRAQGWGFEPK